MNIHTDRRAAVLPAALLSGLVIYLGCLGPARRLVECGTLPQDWYLTIYGPVLNAPVIDDWMRSYARWAVDIEGG